MGLALTCVLAQALPMQLVMRILQNAHVRLCNNYGPAEVTINSQGHRLTVEDTKASLVPIGITLPNTAGFCLDETAALLPAGVAGEGVVQCRHRCAQVHGAIVCAWRIAL